MRLIPVDEVLPTGIWHESHPHLSEDVLILNTTGYCVGRYNRELLEWETDEPARHNTVFEVTHWMSLPAKPPHPMKCPNCGSKQFHVDAKPNTGMSIMGCCDECSSRWYISNYSPFFDWNTLDISESVKYLENEFMFSSTGVAKCIFNLIEFYKQYEKLQPLQ